MNRIDEIECFLLDMDGTIYLGSQLIDGALDFVSAIDASGRKKLFLTNNSSKSRDEYADKLARLGIRAAKDEILTSGEAACMYLRKKAPGSAIFLLGTPALEREFTAAGFSIIKESKQPADFVVLGFDTTLTYEKLWIACDYLQDGVPLIATHPDINCPLEGRRFMPDAGAMLALLQKSTGAAATVIGKPNLPIIDYAAEKSGVPLARTGMVGDRLTTDIQMCLQTELTSFLVLSGETTREMYEQSGVSADYVFPSVKEIALLL